MIAHVHVQTLSSVAVYTHTQKTKRKAKDDGSVFHSPHSNNSNNNNNKYNINNNRNDFKI
jgi:hypothetical protein